MAYRKSVFKVFRHQTLSFVGIVGGGLTLFGSFSTVLQLAGWVEFVVAKWSVWFNAAWDWLSFFLHISIPPATRTVFSLLFFILLAAIGSRVSGKISLKLLIKDISQNVKLLKSRYFISAIAIIFFVTGFSFLFVDPEALSTTNLIFMQEAEPLKYVTLRLLGTAIWGAVIFLVVAPWPKPYSIMAAIGLVMVREIFLWNDLFAAFPSGTEYVAQNVGVIFFAALALLLAEPRAYAWRVWHLIFFFIILIMLNEISKLDISLNPPQL